MSNGKQTKEYGWRSDFLAWEKNASSREEKNIQLWDRMITRLQMPARKKRNYFAWAAAVLFFISGLVFLFNYSFITGNAYAQTFKKHPYLIKNQVLEKPDMPATTITKKNRVKKTVNKATGSINKELLSNAVPEQVVVVVPGTITDSPLPVTTIPANQPKRIRVVHMNEWFSPPPPVYAKSKEEEVLYKPSLWPGKNRGLSPPASNN